MAIHFYKEFGDLGYLATYSLHGFIKDGIYYKTSEHYYQSKKFVNKEVENLIINAETPKIASNIGRDRKNKLIKNWKLVKCDVMYDAVLYKFMAHIDLKVKLLKTGNEEIIEDTVKENYWGCGINKDGTNYYGKILCFVRDKLKEEFMFYFTKEGIEKLLKEIDGLDNEYKETTRLMGKSDEMDSDLRENPEFMDLRVKAMYTIPNKKKELASQLKNAKMIEDTDEYKNWDGETVIRKSKVNINFDGEDLEYSILGYNESDVSNGILSCDSPLSLTMLGHKIGETLEFNGMKIKINNVIKLGEVKKKVK